MPYDTPFAPQKTLHDVRSGPRAIRYAQSRAARTMANGVAPSRVSNVRRIEPMLLVHQEQVETLRLIAVALHRGFKVLARSFAG